MSRVYEHLQFPAPNADRPYTILNMVATVDGKTVSGDRDEHVMDLGSKTDHEALRDIESRCQAVLIGAETLRATKNIWYPKEMFRLVATRSGDLPWGSRFFTDDPSKAIVVSPFDTEFTIPIDGVAQERLEPNGSFGQVCRRLRERGVRSLVVEGGSELNAALIRQGLVDEFFLTIAPRLKLGRSSPTYAGGEPFSRDELPRLELVSAIPVGDEVFLRYRKVDG